MRITSVMPQTYAVNLREHTNSIQANRPANYISQRQVNSLNYTAPVYLKGLSRTEQTPHIHLTFTGGDKNINQFLSYAPENKRYKINSYNLGGLGVVADEGPQSWRTHEGADVRDFSPYHSYANPDGGIKVVELEYDEKGKPKALLSKNNFHPAGQMESLEDVAKRLNKEVKNLAYVIQTEPDAKGLCSYIQLEDTGVSGSFKSVSDESVDKLKEVTYRLFRANDSYISDPVVEAENKYAQQARSRVTAPYIKQIKEALEKENKYEERLKTLNDEDELKFKKDMFSFEPNPEIEKLEKEYAEKINTELKKHEAEIEQKLKELKETKEYKDGLQKIQAAAAPAVNERNSAYFIHTKDLAKFTNAYGVNQQGGGVYGAYGGAYSTGAYGTSGAYGTMGSLDGIHHVSTNTFYGDGGRALVEVLPQLNCEKHGDYNPANLWLHDRPAFLIMHYIIDKSAAGDEYYNGGIISHGSFHNPGRDYQGWMNNPFEFFRLVASEEDVKELRNHPQLKEIKYIEKNWHKFAPEDGKPLKPEAIFIKQIFDPFFKNFMDDFNTYNITMTPVAASKIDGKNNKAGTVSMNYGKEMKNPDTPDIALGLTKKLNEIETHDVTNGSTPANLQLDNPKAGFHRTGHPNILSKLKRGFQTYKYEYELDKDGKIVKDNIDEVIKAKENNTKWLLNIIDHAYQHGGQQGVTKVFCSDAQVSTGATVIGHLSGYKEGDKLFMGWGRPDPQKGYPTSVGAIKEYFEFLKDKNIPDELKLRTKAIFGAGVWDSTADDYKWVKDLIEVQLPKIDNGKYVGNVMYVNNFFANRLVGCATWTLFSSRFEPCGITPLESFASATPCISINTGGAPDFINYMRGLLTKNPYLLRKERLEEILGEKLDGKDFKAIDGARWKNATLELKDCIVMAMQASDNDFKNAIHDQLSEELKNNTVHSYREMAQNAGLQQDKMDWHQNADYNNGKTANERYMNEIFERDKGMEARNKKPMKRLVEKFGIATQKIVIEAESGAETASKSKLGKIVTFSILGVAAIASGGYYFFKKHQKKMGYNKPVEEKTFTKIG